MKGTLTVLLAGVLLGMPSVSQIRSASGLHGIGYAVNNAAPCTTLFIGMTTNNEAWLDDNLSKVAPQGRQCAPVDWEHLEYILYFANEAGGQHQQPNTAEEYLKNLEQPIPPSTVRVYKVMPQAKTFHTTKEAIAFIQDQTIPLKK